MTTVLALVVAAALVIPQLLQPPPVVNEPKPAPPVKGAKPARAAGSTERPSPKPSPIVTTGVRRPTKVAEVAGRPLCGRSLPPLARGVGNERPRTEPEIAVFVTGRDGGARGGGISVPRAARRRPPLDPPYKNRPTLQNWPVRQTHRCDSRRRAPIPNPQSLTNIPCYCRSCGTSSSCRCGR